MVDNTSTTEDNLFSSLMYKYVPFWPLFIGLIVLALGGAWGYLHYLAVPSYSTSATLIIKDEKKGVNDSRMTESIDAFTSNKIVENEIKVIQSHTLMKQVVQDLKLYAPIYEEEKFKSVPAYVTSPVDVEVQHPESIKGAPVIYFAFNEKRSKVKIANSEYPLNEWVKTPYGTMRFTPNPRQISAPANPLYFILLNPKQAAADLFARVSIEAENKMSSVVNLRLDDPSPERGEDILNALIHTYNQFAINERNRIAENTLEFVENRIKLVEKELEELENAVVRFKSTKGAVDLSEQGKLFLRNVGDNDRRISEINTQLAILDKVEAYVVFKNKAAGIVPSTLGVSDPVLSQLLEKLYNSEIQYQRLRATTAVNNPMLLSLTEEIENIRPSILENIRNQRMNLQASKSNLSSTNSQYNSVIQDIPQKERELLEISRQQTIKNNAYSFLLQKREETVLSYAPTASDSRVIDMASASLLPVSPKPLYIYLIAVVLACVTGVGLVTGKELLNNKLLFRSEIESFTKAPIVAELSLVKRPKSIRFSAPTEASVIEQFRQLRITMGLYGRTFTKKKIMVTSSIPGEGKSFISSNLALSLASSGRRVVLLDFDMRNPNTSQQFDLIGQVGLIDYIRYEATTEEITYATQFANLSVLPGGTNIGDHTELLLNGRLENLFVYLEQEFDYVIIDTPPLELVSDGFIISEYSDITLLVMRHAYTPKNLVQRLAQNNKVKSLCNLAIVFNGVKARGFVKGQYGYGYGYGHDFKYGDKTYKSRNVAAKI